MLDLQSKPANVEEAVKAGWRTAKEMYEACETSRQTWENFVADVRKATSGCEKILAEKCITGHHNTKYYHPKVEEAFMLWLKRNQANIGRSSEVVKQAVLNSVENNEYKYSKEDICSICNVDEKTFRRFFEEVRLDTTVQSKIITLAHNKKMYAEPILQKFQLWLKKNAMNAGGQRTEGSIIKQDNQKDLFIGCIATKGTPAEIRSLAEHLMVMADQQELLEQTKQHNQQLLIENHNLSEENNYLKKLTDFQSTQIGYYTKKYHSWYDDYENY